MFGNITLSNSSNSHFDALGIILKNPRAPDTAMLMGYAGGLCALNEVQSHGLLSRPYTPAQSWKAVP